MNGSDQVAHGAATAGPPTSNTGVGSYGWDWTATTHGARKGLVDGLVEALEPALVLPGKGKHGWGRSKVAFDADGNRIGAVYYGGARAGTDIHVESTSDAAHGARARVLAADPTGRTARVDTRLDTLDLSFEDLYSILRASAAKYHSLVTYVASERDGESKGRTLYLGSPTSAVRVRVYEKWLESPGEYPEGTNRVEVQLRPGSRVKDRVSTWEPARTFCASKTTHDLAQRLGDVAAPAGSLHVAKPKVSDLERTIAFMGKQYGRSTRAYLEASGGDIGRLMELMTGDPDFGLVG